MGMRPDLYTAYLMTSSQWDGDLEVLAEARTPVYMAIGEDDSYYGSSSLKEAYESFGNFRIFSFFAVSEHVFEIYIKDRKLIK